MQFLNQKFPCRVIDSAGNDHPNGLSLFRMLNVSDQVLIAQYYSNLNSFYVSLELLVDTIFELVMKESSIQNLYTVLQSKYVNSLQEANNLFDQNCFVNNSFSFKDHIFELMSVNNTLSQKSDRILDLFTKEYSFQDSLLKYFSV